MSPMLRVPRTYKTFAAMMAQCLTKLKIRAAQGSAVLLNVIKNDVREQLPLGTMLVGTSSKAELRPMRDYVADFSPVGTPQQFKSICFVIGAVSIGNPGQENDLDVDTSISIASCGLSAACVCSKVCESYEQHWGVV